MISDTGFPCSNSISANAIRVRTASCSCVPRDRLAQLSSTPARITLSRPRCSEKLSSHPGRRSEEHTSELQSLMRISYAVFCLKKKKDRKYPSTQYSKSHSYHYRTTTHKRRHHNH